jgi:hypothetical protein
MTEQADTKVKEGPQRARKPMSDAQKEKMRQTLRRNKEARQAAIEEESRAAAEQASDGDFLQGHIPEGPVWTPAVDVKTGLDRDERDAIDLALKLDQAETRIREAAISEGDRKLILKEVRVDALNLRRYHVDLTPSMCDVRGCGFDAAKEAGATDWNNAPTSQVMPNGQTIGQRLIALKEYHKATAHTNQALNDHIITADELNKRQWGIGQDIRGDFLTGTR